MAVVEATSIIPTATTTDPGEIALRAGMIIIHGMMALAAIMVSASPDDADVAVRDLLLLAGMIAIPTAGGAQARSVALGVRPKLTFPGDLGLTCPTCKSFCSPKSVVTLRRGLKAALKPKA